MSGTAAALGWVGVGGRAPRVGTRPPGDLTLGSLHRGLAILRLLAERGPMRADAIAAVLHLPLSTTYRYLRVLQSQGFVERCATGLYASGQLFGRAAQNRDAADHIQRLAEAVLLRLAQSTGEAVYLAVRVGTWALVLDRVEPTRWKRRVLPRGTLHPLHIGAAGTALLAFAEEHVLEKVLREIRASSEDAQRLRQRLLRVRATGVSVSHGEMRRGVSGVATPVLREGRPVCAICVAGPTARLKRALPRLCGLVRHAAEELGRTLRTYPKAWTTAEPGRAPQYRKGGLA